MESHGPGAAAAATSFPVIDMMNKDPIEVAKEITKASKECTSST
jgi:hypothetical protein